MRLDAALLAMAEQQQSCVADWQVRDLGGSDAEVARLHASPRWSTPAPGVLSVRGAPPTEATLASAAVLAGGQGTVLSHTAVAAWWGIPGYRLLPATTSRRVEVAHRRRQPGELHRLAVIPEAWITTLRGIAVVRPELMAYQLCGAVHPGRAERAFDAAWARRLLSVSSSRACLAELAKRGRNGTRVFRAILQARTDRDAAPASGLESRVLQILGEAGVRMRRQVNVGGEQWSGRIDFVDEAAPFILEVQSELYHLALSDERHDAERHERYRQDGFEVAAVWEVDVWARPDHLLKVVSAGRQRARQKRRPG